MRFLINKNFIKERRYTMEYKVIGIYVNRLYVEPRQLIDGTWAWVILGKDGRLVIHTPYGNKIPMDAFEFDGKTEDELLSPLNQ